MKIKISVFLLVAALFLCSCTAGNDTALPPGAIPVLSNDPNLTYIVPGDFDADLSQDPQWAKQGYSTYVTEVDGKLAVMPAHIDGSSPSPGVEAGQCYCVDDLWGGAKGVFVAGEAAIPEECIGMVASADKTRVLVFTTAGETSRMYTFEKVNEAWTIQGNTIFEGRLHLLFLDWPSTNYDPPREIYMLTNQSVIVVRSQDYLLGGAFSTISSAEIETPDWWGMIAPTSAVKIDNILFVGDRQGVVGIDLEDARFAYYPLNSER